MDTTIMKKNEHRNGMHFFPYQKYGGQKESEGRKKEKEERREGKKE